jgi:5'(3')-deoxyribonucleotidase
MRQIFLDCDGVLADFDIVAEQIFGQDSRAAEAAVGSEEFWRRIREGGAFYRKLPLMTGALELYKAVAHLRPIILTGCPPGGWSEPQKIEWAAEYFPGVKIITCASKEKFRHMLHRGDVLVDDYLRYKDLWEQAGGVFVHHRSAKQSILELSQLGFPVGLASSE